MRLERAFAATTVARQASVGLQSELSTTKTASYSLMTARTVGVSNSDPFQSAAIRGYRGSRKNLINHTRKQQRLELRRYCRISQLPTTIPVGRLAAKY
eukprot:6003656-Pleurochrysis_carterae.AAC.1